MIPWRHFLGADMDEPKREPGRYTYYCECEYVLGVENCAVHGDPPKRYPEPKKAGGDER